MNEKDLKRYRKLRGDIVYRGWHRVEKTSEYVRLRDDFALWQSHIPALYREIVYCYYHRAWSIRAIALRLHYSESQIKRIKARCLQDYGKTKNQA